jgi:hypothetical protein
MTGVFFLPQWMHTLEIAESELESTDRCICHILIGASNGKRLG